MELKECITCGSHNFTDNKCDYCGNQYEVKEPTWEDILEKQEQSKVYCGDGAEAYAQSYYEYSSETEVTEITFSHGNKRGDKILAFMLYLLLSIIWFAVCVFIPPLFIITICSLIILPVIKKLKNKH